MKKTLLTLCAVVGMTSMAMAWSSGPPAGYAGNNGSYCTQCHSSFGLNSGDGQLDLWAMTEYTPGETYSLEVVLTDADQSRWGFQIAAEDGGGSFAGQFVITDPTNTQLNSGDYVNHTSTGTYNGSNNGSWNFDWTAPAAGTGPVTFYVAGNAANGNFSTSGDYIYAIEMVVNEEAAAPYGLTTTGINTTIPASGGNVTYSIDFFTNVPQSFNNVNYWTTVTLPDGSESARLAFITTNIPANADIFIPMMAQEIPSFAPAGTYSHNAMLGYFPNAVLMDSFTFTKSATGANAAPVTSWDATGEWPELTSNGESVVDLPTEYALNAAYPNPFNAMTNVSVTLPETADLKLRVTNLQGQEVAVISEGTLSAGQHTFSFDAGDLSSGMYFIHANVPGHMSQVQRVTLVK